MEPIFEFMRMHTKKTDSLAGSRSLIIDLRCGILSSRLDYRHITNETTWPGGEWLMAMPLAASGEDELIQNCLQCVPVWRMAEAVKNALLNMPCPLLRPVLRRLHQIICCTVALMYSYTHGRVNFNIFNEVDAGVGNLSRIVDTMLPRTYSQFQRSLFLVSFFILFCQHML